MSDQKIHIAKMTRNYMDNNVADLESSIEKWLLEPFSLIVLDFSDTMQLEQKARQVLLQFVQVLKKNNKQLASLNIRQTLLDSLKKEGTLDSFNPCANLTVAKIRARCEDPNTVFLRHFIQSCLKAFKVQASMNLKIKTISQNKPPPAGSTVSTQIAVDSTEFQGVLCLTLDSDLFKKFYFQLLDEEILEIDEEHKDAACEVLNILFGLAKTTLVDEYNYILKPAIPSLVNDSEFNNFDFVAEIQSQFGSAFLSLKQGDPADAAKVA